MKKYICEGIGTFVLVFIGCMVAVMSKANILAIALAFGLSLTIMYYVIGSISGCHINPAVSFSMYLNKKMDKEDLKYYVIAQVIGAIIAALLLGIVLGSFKRLGANTYITEGSLATGIFSALVIEIILTFIFIVTVLEVTSKKENSLITGIIIGLSLTLVHLAGTRITGTSVNPARSIGPALFQEGSALKQLWIFIIAPLIGAYLASSFYKNILLDKEITVKKRTKK